MDVLNPFFETIGQHTASAIMLIIGRIFLFAFAGLAIGIALIKIGSVRNWFRRPYRFWNVLVKINYLYVPLLFLVFGACTGAINGVYATASRIIDAASEQIISYGKDYMTDFQTYLAETEIAESGKSLKEVVNAHLATKQEVGFFSGFAASAFNVMIVRMCMTKAGFAQAAQDPFLAVETLKKEDLTSAVLSIPAMALQFHCDLVFWGFFVGLWGLFLPFFCAPVIEMGIYTLFNFF